ncbi:MAG TPA: transcriptional repressor [Bryobacteraceae bacterium]|jgi:Fur family peroxide stress response transcriptional regulator|nr:transcriptional repressor [Bryobacteraceae bacterium]
MSGSFSPESFRQLCLEHGLAVTHQRQVLYEALMSFEGHPSPEAVFEKVRQQIPSISLGTVYKNIKTFVESGLIREVSLHHGSTRLETNLEPHHHLVCERCRAIYDVDEADVEPVRLRRELPPGFEPHRYSLEFIGLCHTCAEK